MKMILTVLNIPNCLIITLVLLISSSHNVLPASSTFTNTKIVSDNTATTANIVLSTSVASTLFSINNLVPGDTITRQIEVTNSGTADALYIISTSTTSTTPTLLWTDTTNGLQLKITNVATAGVLYEGALSSLSTANIPISVGAIQTLEFIVSLPTTADNTFQNLSENVTFSFNLSQAAGTAK